MASARLTAEQKSLILQLHNEGWPDSRIAKLLGGHWARVQRFLRSVNGPRPEGRIRQHTVNENAFENAAQNDAAAYFVGLLMADGCVSGKYPTISLTAAAQDVESVYALRSFLSSTHSVATNPKGAATLQISSRRLAESLGQYGVTPRKSFTAKVAGLETNRHFWRGVIDGDGMIVDQGKRMRNAPAVGLVGSHDLLWQFFDFCIQLVPNLRARPRRMQNIWALVITGRYAQAVIRHLYIPCELALSRKMRAAETALDWKPVYKERTYQNPVPCIRD